MIGIIERQEVEYDKDEITKRNVLHVLVLWHAAVVQGLDKPEYLLPRFGP
jgi:hypothetical protein